MKASETKLQPVLEGVKQYVVPLFQRSYSWKKNLWDTLWQDLLELYESNDVREHFMGAIVTMPVDMSPHGVSKYLLIDGQQRLTTLFIVLAVIRDLAKANENEKLYAQIHETYLVNKWEEGVNWVKLLPTQTDREAFWQIVEGKKLDQTSKLTKVYNFFKRKLESFDQNGESFDLKRVQTILTQQFVVVGIVLAKDENPYLIFESLNAKGEPLTQADLVRNYIFMRITDSNEQQMAYKELWLPMQEKLGDELTNFLWRYLNKDGTFVRQNSIYEAIKGKLSQLNTREVVDVLMDMYTYAGYYARLIYPEQEPNPQIRYRLIRINRWEIKTAYPFLLAIYDDYDHKRLSVSNICQILDALESFVIRRFFCRIPTNSLNRIFISIYNSLDKNEMVESTKSFLLARNWPSDSQFLERWMHFPIYTSGITKTRHILESLERVLTGNNEPVDVNYHKITIEHVMPQTLNEDWENDLGSEALKTHEMYLHTIGNLTLTGNNEPMGNNSFHEKKKVLSRSNLALNKYFAGHEIWNEDAIRQRAQELGKFASRLWSRPAVDEEVVKKDNPTGYKPTGFTFLGKKYEVESWRQMLMDLLVMLHKLHGENFIANAMKVTGSKRRYVTYNKNELRTGVLLPGTTNLWVETNLSSTQIISVLTQIVLACGYNETDFEAHW